MKSTGLERVRCFFMVSVLYLCVVFFYVVLRITSYIFTTKRKLLELRRLKFQMLLIIYVAVAAHYALATSLGVCVVEDIEACCT